MEDFNDKQKEVILWILSGIMKADHIIHKKELNYFNEVAESLHVNVDMTEKTNAIEAFEALDIIASLSQPQKEYVAQLMGNMIVVDEDINYNEVKLYNNICRFCDINHNFSVNDYSEFSLSGPFNPEYLR